MVLCIKSCISWGEDKLFVGKELRTEQAGWGQVRGA
jgi:hypothetical protein